MVSRLSTHPIYACVWVSVLALYAHTIAGEGEGSDVSEGVLDEGTQQLHIQDHTLHQDPHEAGQEEVVQQDGHNPAARRHTPLPHRRHPGNKHQLRDGEAHTQVDMDVAPHAPQRPAQDSGTQK